MAVIAALTAQNSGRVTGTWAVDPETVRAQIVTLLEDITPRAVKTGMLADARVIASVVSALPAGVPLVVDPVMVSTSGHRLLEEDAVEVLIGRLIPRATVVTPNLPEAGVLTGRDTIAPREMAAVGEEILRMGPEWVVIKGGHAGGTESIDLLISADREIPLSGPRYPYEVHGSGCCFSAAITGFLSRGEDVPAACDHAKILTGRAIARAVPGRSGIRMMNPTCIEGIFPQTPI